VKNLKRSSPIPPGRRWRKFKPPYELVITLLPGVKTNDLVKRGGRRLGKHKVIFRSNSLLDFPI